MNDDLFLKIAQEIGDSGELHYVSGPATEDLISSHEAYVEVPFSESYKIFLRQYGTLTFNGLSFYGISKQGLSTNSAPDVKSVTLEARKSR
ncbi:SMI1/KNR4 family protein [Kosakonia sacchari]|uniref:SMI1/KNR4 family protein n=1 Tax=Kosakonia sacchari TaxID=1158459 RepID=UPI002ACE49B1|nr:SMI1/KNR4 family protein [Kosakonia sacchari]MDZ7323915.1 SMI1/KNR4 family protein [Kosakonia sacchari]